jgi:hypothetical protein
MHDIKPYLPEEILRALLRVCIINTNGLIKIQYTPSTDKRKRRLANSPGLYGTQCSKNAIVFCYDNIFSHRKGYIPG